MSIYIELLKELILCKHLHGLWFSTTRQKATPKHFFHAPKITSVDDPEKTDLNPPVCLQALMVWGKKEHILHPRGYRVFVLPWRNPENVDDNIFRENYDSCY